MSYIDGPAAYSNAYLTENTVGYPLPWPNNSSTAEYQLAYVQSIANYVSANLGSTDANAPSSVLVSKGPLQRIGSGVVRYGLTFQQLPNTWTETQEIVYTYPGLSAINVVIANALVLYSRYGLREPITIPKLATVTHEYVISNTSPVANIQNVTIVTFANNPVDYIGSDSYYSAIVANTYTVPNADPATWVVSSQAQIWKWPIWEVITVTVTGPNTFI